MTHLTRSALVASFLAASAAYAGSSAPAPSGKNSIITPAPEKEESVFDKIWGLATLYKSDTGFLNELALTGRYHGQFYSADNGLSEDDWDNRRFRLGAQATLLDKKAVLKFEMFSDLNSSDDAVASSLSGGRFFDGFTEAYLRLQPSEAFNITIGKQKPKFGLEWTTSSRLLLAFERSVATSQFKPDYASGVSVDGKVGAFDYYAGVFSNDITDGGDEIADFGGFDGDYSVVAGFGIDLKEQIGTDSARLGLGFIHSEHDVNDDIYTAYDNGASLNFALTQGDFGLTAEVLYGEGDVGNNWGFTVTPSYYIIPKKLQFVARYQLGLSDEDNGLAPRTRYEKVSGGSASGDVYNAAYAGLNYYIYDHKLKLMTGVEYANMDGGATGGFDGWTYFAGVRLYW